jgi:NitT/TauT family transport system permease protein
LGGVKQTSHRIVSFLPFGLILLVWYVLTQTGAIDPIFLPSPVATLRSFVSLLSASFFLQHLFPSLTRVGLAFLFSVLIALPLGILSGQSSFLARLIQPLCGFTRYLPVAALVPLTILWFGIDDGQKIAVIMIGVVFQLTLLLAADTSSVPQELIEAGRTFGLSRWQVIWRIVLPSSLPAVWDDLRISAGWAWSYLILAELVAGNRGIGYFIIQSQRYLDTDRVFAGILMIGLLGVLTDLGFRLVGSRIFRWV